MSDRNNKLAELFLGFLNRARTKMAWDRIAEYYDLSMPPNAPSSEDAEFYREYLKTISPGKRILILGVTPQLRALMSDFEGEIIIADFSKKMYRSTQKILDNKIFDKEKFIWADWLNLKKILAPARVDLVMGDFVFMQIAPKDREKFISVIGSILKPDGLFVTRVKIHNPYWVKKEPLEIIKANMSSELFKQSGIDSLLIYRFGDKILNLTDYSFESKDFVFLLKAALAKVSDTHEKNHILRMLNHWSRVNMLKSYFPKSYFESLIALEFKIVDICYSNDYEESEFSPIYVLKKK